MKMRIKLVISLVVLVIALVACGTNNNSDQGDLTGNVVIDGSGTVFPLMSRIAEEYMLNEQEGVSVEVSRAGTSAGFSKFLMKDGTNFNNASRKMKEEEIKAAQNLN